jgi:hypothetical protein
MRKISHLARIVALGAKPKAFVELATFAQLVDYRWFVS